jgi:hypothetical protein
MDLQIWNIPITICETVGGWTKQMPTSNHTLKDIKEACLSFSYVLNKCKLRAPPPIHCRTCFEWRSLIVCNNKLMNKIAGVQHFCSKCWDRWSPLHSLTSQHNLTPALECSNILTGPNDLFLVSFDLLLFGFTFMDGAWYE